MAGELIDQEWASFAALGADERVSRMTEHCRAAAALDDTARISALESMIRAEYALPQTALHAFTASRLRAWIAVDQTDRELATRLARGYDSVFQHLPGEMAMRRAATVQGVARSELTADEVEVLFELIPSIVQQVPRVRHDSLTARPAGTGPAERSKPWWRFW